MPNLDGTGPAGEGPMTGRGQGMGAPQGDVLKEALAGITQQAQAIAEFVPALAEAGAPKEALAAFQQASELMMQGIEMLTGGGPQGQPQAVEAAGTGAQPVV